ncbi:hypothetical protein [Neorhizobium galegae]|uniref:hypothetical protein n=1 Tax=Neorhizobium galegae TaxID=399 RepID=UPI0018D78799|nr:hypothetical protein [Neorhizobium galegae]
MIRKAVETPHVGSMPDHQNLARGQIAGRTDQSGDHIDWPMPAFACCRSMKNIKRCVSNTHGLNPFSMALLSLVAVAFALLMGRSLLLSLLDDKRLIVHDL